MGSKRRLDTSDWLQLFVPMNNHAKDKSGHNIVPAWTGTELYAPGAFGKSTGSFNGSSTIALGSVALTTGNATLCVWAKSSMAPTTGVSFLDAATGRIIFAWNGSTSGKLGLFDGAWRAFGDAPNDGQWHFIVLTLDAGSSQASMYVDCEQSGNTSAYSPKNIAGVTACGGGYTGLMSNLRVYGALLTLEEIADLYASER